MLGTFTHQTGVQVLVSLDAPDSSFRFHRIGLSRELGMFIVRRYIWALDWFSWALTIAWHLSHLVVFYHWMILLRGPTSQHRPQLHLWQSQMTKSHTLAA